LTGATGLIGGAVLHRALTSNHPAQWVCLVRAPDAEAGRQRIAARLGRFTNPLTAQRLAQRVEVVAGDFTQADRINDARLDSVTQVLHLAADTSWWAQEKVHKTNHDGTLALARRASRMKGLTRFLHVSTAMICGAAPAGLIDETRYPAHDANHLVHYSASKAAAEMSLAQQFPDLPLVVARPSIVIGHTALGARPGSSILWVMRAGDKLRLLSCDPDGAIDIVPADWVADTLIAMLDRPALAHKVYHLSGGERHCTRWDALAHAFEAADPEGGTRFYEPFAAGDRARLQARFAEVFGLDEAIKVAMMRALQAYYRFCALNVTFSNDRLLSEGFAPPPSLPQYLARCLETSGEIVDQFHEDFGNYAPGQAPQREVRPRLPAGARVGGARAPQRVGLTG
jgi:nucleoside-diphosphate-sugar epimerase